jgi:hypothetical protein
MALKSASYRQKMYGHAGFGKLGRVLTKVTHPFLLASYCCIFHTSLLLWMMTYIPSPVYKPSSYILFALIIITGTAIIPFISNYYWRSNLLDEHQRRQKQLLTAGILYAMTLCALVGLSLPFHSYVLDYMHYHRRDKVNMEYIYAFDYIMSGRFFYSRMIGVVLIMMLCLFSVWIINFKYSLSLHTVGTGVMWVSWFLSSFNTIVNSSDKNIDTASLAYLGEFIVGYAFLFSFLIALLIICLQKWVSGCETPKQILSGLALGAAITTGIYLMPIWWLDMILYRMVFIFR